MDIMKYAKALAGIVSGGKVFTGPFLVQLDLTNTCNTRCLYCMNYSKLGLEREYPKEWMGTSLELEYIKKVIPELRALDVKQVDLVGNGEPFAHPHILEVIRLVKENGMRCTVRTNGLLIDRGMVDHFMTLGLDGIDLSLWAGSGPGYVETHPLESEESFLKIRDWLGYLAEQRALHRAVKGFHLKILNVIGRRNFSRIREMLDFGGHVKADYVIFKPVMGEFFKPEVQDALVLTEDEKRQVAGICDDASGKTKVRHNLREFVDAGKRVYRVQFCWFGWLYSRLTVSGDVIPCCGCLEHSMGNFKDEGFEKIWNGQKYREFRRRSRNIHTDGYFSDCSCNRICPHFLPIISYSDLLRFLYAL